MCLNNILHFGLRGCEIQSYVGVMLFSRLTVKAKDMLFIQRDKRRAERRQLTECQLGLRNRECMKIKSQCDIFPFVLLNATSEPVMKKEILKKFVGRSKYCLEIFDNTWEKLACSSLLRSLSERVKINRNGGDLLTASECWELFLVLRGGHLLTFLRGSVWRLTSAMKRSTAVSLCKVNEPNNRI